MQGDLPLQPKSAGEGVVAEHLYRVQRVFLEILADEGELVQDVGGHGDDVAADIGRLDDVQTS